MSSDKKIVMKMILEVAGRPAEHLAEALNEHIEKINEEKDVEVIDKTIHEPVLMKNQDNFWTSFAEVEVNVSDVSMISVIALKYMPAHIEIIGPELIAFTNNGWSDIFNDVLQRLHHYDEVARIMQSEKMILTNKLKSLLNKKEEKKD